MSIFNNLETAFKDKTNYDLNRAYFLFLAINNSTIASILTSILRIAIYLKLPVTSIIKSTIYKHFCGGTSIENSQNTINKLWKSNIGTILDFSAEGKAKEEDFTKVMQETILSINKAKDEKSIPFSVFKPTGLASFNLLEKINNHQHLNNKEKEENQKFKLRINNICKTANDNNTPIFIDAEESWIQNNIDNIALNMMRKYNKNKAIIFNTLQLYRKDRIDYLKYMIKDAKTKKYIIGVKLVRGAYHEQEIKRAKINNITCPVYKNKYDTDKNYNHAIKICIENINYIELCVGTHNEKSIEILIQLMKQHNIKNNNKKIYISQLLGMSDNISYNAAKENYNVAKYVPYGPVKDVLPYLIRRAEENTSISGQMGRELKNIIKEKKRRLH